MGKKAEAGTPKWLANKMKSKGLQKLRWYCQMCNKQCRDQNGFKCHIQSESHQRQLLIFADNPNKFLGDFSKEFEWGFMNLLKRCHGTKRVEANKVYQEYIGDKEHVHMNATRWTTLTGFVTYLGKTGKCVVDETEKGWYVTWIDRDPETIARQEALAKKDKLEKDDSERMMEFIEKQVARAKEVDKDRNEQTEELKEFIRLDENEKVQLQLKTVAKKTEPSVLPSTSFKSLVSSTSGTSLKNTKAKKESINKRSALEDIMKEEEEQKKRSKPIKDDTRIKDYWLKKNIVVKIVTKSLGDKYYKQKGYVKEVVDKYVAIVILLNSGSKLKLDQDHLETVIPSENKEVLVLNGKYRNELGLMKSVDVDNFSARIQLKEDGKIVSLPYEHFSKVYSTA